MEIINHIIQKQVLEVEMENPADAFQFRNRLGEVYHEKILPQLEDLFDKIGTADKLIRIEKLEVDIGTVSSKDWEATLADKIISEVRQLLVEQNVQWNKPVAAAQKALDSNLGKTESLQTDLKYPINEIQLTQQSIKEFEDVFLYFLQTGRLPWYVSNTIDLQDLLKKLLFTEAIELLNGFLKNADSQLFIRLIYQVDESILDEMIAKLIGQHQPIFYANFIQAKSILGEITSSFLINKSAIKKIVYLPLFTALYNNEETDLAKRYGNKFISILIEDFPRLVSVFAASLNLIDGNSNTILKNLPELVAAATSTNEKPPVNKFQIQTDKKNQGQFNQKIIEQEAVEIYIDNAGLVLLNPFLLPLFNQIHLTVTDSFADDYARMKAVLLTQFLVNGMEVFEEQHLVLNKILCGIPIDEPIFMELEITDEEREEAADLLNQIIQLWTKNNNQVNGTTEGLQQSFLQRPGKLIKKGDDWQLQVEQRAYDMLLSSLPWGIGIIKTSWMKGMLWVEWA